MAKTVNKGITWWQMGLFIVIIVAGFSYVSLNQKSIANPYQNQYITIPANVQSSGQSCVGSNPASGFPKLLMVGQLYDQANSLTLTQKAVGVNVVYTILGQSPTILVGSDPSSGVLFFNGTIPCGTTITPIYGDNKNFYQIAAAQQTLTQQQTQITFPGLLQIANIGAPTWSNQTSFGVTYTTGVTPGALATAGSDYNYFSVRIPAGSGVYGVQNQSVTALFNSVAIQYVHCPGFNQYNGQFGPAFASTSNDPAGFATYTCVVPALTTWSGFLNVPIDVRMSSSFSANTGIGFIFNDQVLFLLNGQLIPRYVDPNLNTDLGSTQTVQAGTTEFNGISSLSAKPPIQLFNNR